MSISQEYLFYLHGSPHLLFYGQYINNLRTVHEHVEFNHYVVLTNMEGELRTIDELSTDYVSTNMAFFADCDLLYVSVNKQSFGLLVREFADQKTELSGPLLIEFYFNMAFYKEHCKSVCAIVHLDMGMKLAAVANYFPRSSFIMLSVNAGWGNNDFRRNRKRVYVLASLNDMLNLQLPSMARNSGGYFQTGDRRYNRALEWYEYNPITHSVHHLDKCAATHYAMLQTYWN
jgi:hypothetical protein